ncbi:nuclear transport factor 2 family protein [Thalassococcus sp. S3]|uniref:nuclear transport factor 2 family protein n=1 Tax=Thalassococcus sp. S3 TaxID=2017482 RepID=UPI0013EEC394|nr:nuclear transport factor 2 family protein [Thalassococcus sp. S3]
MTHIISAFFSNLGDLEKAKAFVDPDAIFVGVREHPDVNLPIYGTFRGHDGMMRFVGALKDAFDTQLFEIDMVHENPTEGFATGRFEHRVKRTGALFRSRWALFAQFRDGRISHYRFFEDTAALEEALGVRTICREAV